MAEIDVSAASINSHQKTSQSATQAQTKTQISNTEKLTSKTQQRMHTMNITKQIPKNTDQQITNNSKKHRRFNKNNTDIYKQSNQQHREKQ